MEAQEKVFEILETIFVGLFIVSFLGFRRVRFYFSGYSVHVVALNHILQLICSYTEKLSLLFADDINWFEVCIKFKFQ